MTASPGIFIYKDAKLFTQHLMLGAAGSTTLTEVCIGFSSWWRDCHIQSECARLLHCLTPYSSLVVFFSGVASMVQTRPTSTRACHAYMHQG